MAGPVRPKLNQFVEQKAPPPAAPSTEPDDAETTREVEPPAAAPSDLKTMQVRVNRAGWVEMSRLAQDLDIPLERLMVDAFNDVLVKHRKPPVVERRLPVKK
ncbi:hypothetical protein ACQKQD_18350 [Methylobacterium sp. NPDC080182]|uniref:hypothetical protein n=1 Tax=Methylobacterium sp. NPDC080182 TaxID=3390590 RepID=UPI003D038217